MNNNYIVKKSKFSYVIGELKIPNFCTEIYKENNSSNYFNKLNGEVTSIYDGYCDYDNTGALIKKDSDIISVSNELNF